MKLSSISLIATALAAIAGSTTVAQAGPGIYSRGLPVYPNYRHAHQIDHYHTGVLLHSAAKVNEEAAKRAHDAGPARETEAEEHLEAASDLNHMSKSHFKAAESEERTHLYAEVNADRDYALKKERKARETLKDLGF